MPEMSAVKESLRNIPSNEFVDIALDLPHPLYTPEYMIIKYSADYRGLYGLACNMHSRALDELGEKDLGDGLHSGLDRLGLGLQAWYIRLEQMDSTDSASHEAMTWLKELACSELIEAVAPYTDRFFKTEGDAARGVVEIIAEEIDEIIEAEIPAFDELRKELFSHLKDDSQTIEEINNELLGVRLGAVAVRNSIVINDLNTMFRQS